MKIALIFPGWGVPRKLYELLDTQGYEKIFVEPDLVHYAERIVEQDGCEAVVIAWSMGTLSAMEFIRKCNIKKAVLMSPTVKFTESQPEVIVRKMIKGIEKNSEEVLKNFSFMNFSNKQNFEKYHSEYNIYFDKDKKKLIYGLEFLIEKDVSGISFSDVSEPLVIAAKYDEIIKVSESANAAALFRKHKYVELECGHNMIFEKTEEVNRLLRGYINDREEQSKE